MYQCDNSVRAEWCLKCVLKMDRKACALGGTNTATHPKGKGKPPVQNRCQTWLLFVPRLKLLLCGTVWCNCKLHDDPLSRRPGSGTGV